MLRFFRLRASAHEKAHGNRNRKLGKYRGNRGGEHHIGREILGGQRGCGGDRCRGGFHQHEAQGIQRVLRKQRRADSQSDQGHE